MAYVRESDVVAPAQMLVFGDSILSAMTRPPLWAWQTFFAPAAYYHVNPTVTSLNQANLPDRTRAQAHRGRGRFNVVFCDDHVEALKTNQLFGLTDPVMSLWHRDYQPHREV